jgi:DNA repair exonuclease SbcCD ATPase subunit
MKLLRAEIQGFRSFSVTQTLDFSALRPGLYHVTGRNLVEPELEANGAGKSSLFEAIFWALYGKTSRNLKAGVVKNWNSKEKCGVILDLQTSSGSMSLLRAWEPNALEVSDDGSEPRPVDQPELERLIGMIPEAFLFSIYFAQFSPAFVDLIPSEQTKVFSSVLNLGLWERASAAAGDHSKVTEERLQQLREVTARIQGQAEELLSQDYTEAEKGWKKEHDAAIQRVEGSTAALSAAIIKAKKEVTKEREGSDEFRRLRGIVEDKGKVVSLAAYEQRQLEKELTTLRGKDLKKCPTCGAPMSNEHVKKEIKRVTTTIEKAEEQCKRKHEDFDKATHNMVKYRGSEVALLEAEKRLATLQSDLKAAEERRTDLSSQKNPFTKLKEEQEKKGELLAEQLDKTEGKLLTEEKHSKAVQYWVKGFKEIRLSLIRESLAQLTIEVNEVLFQLGLQDWEVAFDIERETKSGSINRSFTIMIRAPHVKDPVPWGVWSGGESQRLRLAISMGFSNLICNRMGVQPNWEMYDEPSTWLSEAGIQDLLTVLAERAERQQKIILLADHRALDFGGFAGIIMVTKNESGSLISTV